MRRRVRPAQGTAGGNLSGDGTDWLFRKRTALIVAGIGGASLLAFLVLLPMQGQLSGPPPHGPNGYSRSAIGYHGLWTVVESWGYPVLRTRGGARVESGDLLVLAEPDEGPATKTLGSAIERVSERGGRVVLVLPKWKGVPSEDNPGWVAEVERLPAARPNGVLKAALGEDCRTASGSFGGGGRVVRIAETQLVDGACEDLEPWLDDGSGMLVSTSLDHRLWVVSDPDLLNNAGLGKGDHAAVFRDLLAEIRPANVVVDESIHGFGRAASLWARLAEFPLVLVPIQLLGMLAVVLWIGLGRFGKPEAPPARVGRGKDTLIDNTARLLKLGGHRGYAIRRYMSNVFRDVAARYSAPRDVAMLAGMSRSRGIAEDLGVIVREAEAMPAGGGEGGGAVRLAMRLHAWREAMLKRGL